MSGKKLIIFALVVLQILAVGLIVVGMSKFDLQPIAILYIEGALLGGVLAAAIVVGIFYCICRVMSFLGSLLYVLETLALVGGTIYVCAVLNNLILLITLASASLVMVLGLIPILCRRN